MRLHQLLPLAMLCVAFTPKAPITEYDKQFFIDTYAAMAVAEMHASGIPASIKLGQAILESGWGRGTVAEGGNNYFCIKCNNGWQGPTLKAKDDEKGLSCFRKYQTVFESFRDHSLFLMRSPRYKQLFALGKTDFEAWAKGLKSCGYATDKAYAERLIAIIEEYGLWVYDYAIADTHFTPIDTEEISIMDFDTDFETEIQEVEEPGMTHETIAPATAEPPVYFYQTHYTGDWQKPQMITPATTEGQSDRKTKIRPILPQPANGLERVD